MSEAAHMTIQRQFICKNLEGGYTLLTLNEFDGVFYLTKKDKPVSGATYVSREIFGILQRGLLNRKYTKFEGNYIECIDKKYIWALWLCVGENEVSTERIQKFCEVERYTALRMVNWMERMGYVSPEEDRGRKVLIDMDEFIAQFGQTEI